MCDGNELHEHFSIDTQTYVEHEHEHDVCEHEYNRLHHHPPVDHHNQTNEELYNKHRDTGKKLNAE